MNANPIIKPLKPGLGPDFFRGLAVVSEHALLEVVNALAVREDLESLNGFVEFLSEVALRRQEGEGGFQLSWGELSVEAPSNSGDVASGSKQFASFPSVFAKLVATPAGIPVESARLVLLQRLILALGSMSGGRARLEGLLVQFAVSVTDVRAYEDLAKEGFTEDAVFVALRAGNFDVATCLLHLMPTSSDLRYSELLNPSHSFSTTWGTVKRVVLEICRGKAPEKFHALKAFHEFLCAYEARALQQALEHADTSVHSFRCGIVSGYLQGCIDWRNPSWEPEVLAVLGVVMCGEPEASPLHTLAEQARARSVDERTLSGVRSCVETALGALCAPVLEVLAPVLSESENRASWIQVLFARRLGRTRTVDADRLAACVDVLVRAGCDFAAPDYGSGSQYSGSALHYCVTGRESTSEGLADLATQVRVLLAAGVDPDLLDASGRRASEYLMKKERAQCWEEPTRVFFARREARLAMASLSCVEPLPA